MDPEEMGEDDAVFYAVDEEGRPLALIVPAALQLDPGGEAASDIGTRREPNSRETLTEEDIDEQVLKRCPALKRLKDADPNEFNGEWMSERSLFERQARWKKNLEPGEYLLPEDRWQKLLIDECEYYGPNGKKRKEFLEKQRRWKLKEYQDSCLLNRAIINDLYSLTDDFNPRKRKLEEISKETWQEAVDQILRLHELCHKMDIYSQPREKRKKFIEIAEQVFSPMRRSLRLDDHPINGDETTEFLEHFIQDEIIETASGYSALADDVYTRFMQWLERMKSPGIPYA